MDHILEISASHWRHFRFTQPIPLKPGVNLLLGKNGSGKTSMLSLLHEASSNGAHTLSPEARNLDEGAILTTVLFSSDGQQTRADYVKRGDGGQWSNNTLHDKLRVISSSRSVTSGNTVKNPFLNSLGMSTTSTALGETIDVAEEFNKAILKELIDIINEKLKGDTDFLKDIQDDYQNGLVDFEKQIRIDPTKENAVFFIDHKERVVPINDLSSGEKEYLYFYAYLRRIRDDENKIVLIDEPELHLHSSQIRKLCEIISSIALKNQVIIATHSGEILQHFFSQANLVLLSKENVTHIENSDQMRQILEEMGLPIDPSVFTAHWICAENDPSVALFGGGPTTPEILNWIFGGNVKKRYWSFGSNKANAKIYEEGVVTAATNPLQIKVTPILDGDTLVKTPENYFPPAIPASTTTLAHFPFWEIENVFLIPGILDAVIPAEGEQSGSARFWLRVQDESERLASQIKKTVAKNHFRQFSLDRHINSTNVQEDLERWKEQISGTEIDLSSVDDSFARLVTEQGWRWLPGKEALSLVLELEPLFWSKIRELQKDGSLCEILNQEEDIRLFRAEIIAL